MPDDSLIDEMRLALQGDRERAEERRRTPAPVPAAPRREPRRETAIEEAPARRRPRALLDRLRRRA